jgi:tetratricopeptide (TPR) repeat protein
MRRKTAYLALVCLPFVSSLAASGRYVLRGEIVAEGEIRFQDLAVELYADGEPHAERAYVAPSGAFEFRNVANGLHRLRVTTQHGETLREEFVHIGSDPAPLTIRLRGGMASARPGGIVSARRLAFKPSKLAKKEWREAEKCLRRGEHAEAAGHLRECVAADPDYFEAHLHLGTALLMSGDAAGALAAFEKAVEIDPHSAYALVHRGMVLLHFRRAAEAEDSAAKALRIEDSPSAHYVLGLSLAAQNKNLPEAVEHLKLAASRHPQAAELAARLEANRKAHQ